MNSKLDAIKALQVLDQFIGPAQKQTVVQCFRGEEKQFFFDKMTELAVIVSYR